MASIFKCSQIKKDDAGALAKLADVSYQTISSVELGTKALWPENIIKISQALQVSTDYLLTGNRNTSDYITLDSKLSTVDSAKHDRIMRGVDIIPEEA